MFNLTKRQLICFSVAALIGVPSFFFLKRMGSNSMAAMGMMVVMMPFFFLAMYEKNGQPLEVIFRHFYQATFVRPKVRPYQTNNYYAALIRQAQAQKEVESIVRISKENKEKERAGASDAGALNQRGKNKGKGSHPESKEGLRGSENRTEEHSV